MRYIKKKKKCERDFDIGREMKELYIKNKHDEINVKRITFQRKWEPGAALEDLWMSDASSEPCVNVAAADEITDLRCSKGRRGA